jgi:hypothetical protein
MPGGRSRRFGVDTPTGAATAARADPREYSAHPVLAREHPPGAPVLSAEVATHNVRGDALGSASRGSTMTTEWEARRRQGAGGPYRDNEHHHRRDRDHDRDWMDRTGDEVRSWFGDDEAERRRDEDERREAAASARYGRRGGGASPAARGMRAARNPFGQHRYADSDFMEPDVRDGGWRGGDDAEIYGDVGPYSTGYDPSFSGHGVGRRGGRREGDHGDGRGGWSRGAGEGRYGHAAAGGLHRGRGPKNYVRSDDRIREDVSDGLMLDPHLDPSEIEVTVSSGEVTLDGTVEDRSAKRRAEDIVETVSGVTHVQNNLRLPGRSAPGAVVAQGGGETSGL